MCWGLRPNMKFALITDALRGAACSSNTRSLHCARWLRSVGMTGACMPDAPDWSTSYADSESNGHFTPSDMF